MTDALGNGTWTMHTDPSAVWAGARPQLGNWAKHNRQTGNGEGNIGSKYMILLTLVLLL